MTRTLFLALALFSVSSLAQALQLQRPRTALPPPSVSSESPTASSKNKRTIRILPRKKNTNRNYRQNGQDSDDSYDPEHTRSIFGKALRKASFKLKSGAVLESTAESVGPPPQITNTEAAPVRQRRKLKKVAKVPVTNAEELRAAVLDQGRPFKSLAFAPKFDAPKEVAQILNHDVLQILAERFRTGSTPGHRAANDTAKVALAMEGGGMRGCVSAGMAAAIACLGLSDSFDAIYGSSAGSVIGSYFVSRQMATDVYTQILPAAQKKFCCKKRIMGTLAVHALDMLYNSLMKKKKTTTQQLATVAELAVEQLQEQEQMGSFSSKFPVRPGMNMSFVLDGIMGDDHGIRPLDMDMFRQNDKLQPLRVASSCVFPNGTLYSRCFGSDDFDTANCDGEDSRSGLFACLLASMTVPGAAGPPVRIRNGDEPAISCFDAFCFEPLPYRSAVEEGATHVLVLCSRPDGFVPKHKPGVYEQGVAPLYFRTHGLPQVASFFERGGQQYIYAEDLLTLEDGKRGGDAIPVPPPDILYGLEEESSAKRDDRSSWNRAHLLPVKVPEGTPELATLEQDRDAVLSAVRSGFAAAFDLLVPALGLELECDWDGEEAARWMFPDEDADGEDVLEETIRVLGHVIEPSEVATVLETPPIDPESSPAEALLAFLPGFREGRLAHLARGLRQHGFETAAISE